MHDSGGMPLVYVGLGANLGEREETIRAALRRLDAHHAIDVRRVSRLRETDPVGLEDQPQFLNGVACIQTSLEPRELLALLLDVERDLGRTRGGPRYGPRTIDLDILLYDDRVIDEPGLRVPHPRIAERAFVLEPLAELDPGLEVPGRGSVRALLAGLQ
jgi:2-amino-4-hydroxy-6-hydroxymethyldihydropteridine diphosphokinase